MLQKKLYAKSFFILLQKFFFEKLLAKRILVNPILSSIKTWFLSTPPGGGVFFVFRCTKISERWDLPAPKGGGGCEKNRGILRRGVLGFFGFFWVFWSKTQQTQRTPQGSCWYLGGYKTFNRSKIDQRSYIPPKIHKTKGFMDLWGPPRYPRSYPTRMGMTGE